MKNALSGKSPPPKQRKTYEDIISWVKENVGAIAYVPKSIMPKSGVKSLIIDGIEIVRINNISSIQELALLNTSEFILECN